MKTLVCLRSPKFPLGELVITTNASCRIGHEALEEAISRHVSGDWGDICPDDARLNEDAFKHGDRVFSAYGTGEDRFWIITEIDPYVTTVLMPEDY